MEKPKISFFTERLYVRSLEETDKDNYMDLREATSSLSPAYKSVPGFRDHEWEGEFNSQNEIYVAVFFKNSPELVASASFQNFNSNEIEFGFDVSEKYRNQGVATELVRGMIEASHSLFPGRTFLIRTEVTNSACRRVAEKLGGVLCGYEPTLAAKAIATLMESYGNKPTDDQELIQMRKRNAEFIEENKEGVCVYRLE